MFNSKIIKLKFSEKYWLDSNKNMLIIVFILPPGYDPVVV